MPPPLLTPLSLTEIHTSNLRLLESSPSPLTAVFTGGTCGIGSYTLHALCRAAIQTSRPVKIYLLGRNAASAEKVLKQYEKNRKVVEIIWIQSQDLSLISDVDRCCDEIVRREEEGRKGRGKIDFMVMTHADLSFGPWRGTSEGLEKSFTLMYYSRVRFVFRLMGLLEKGIEVGKKEEGKGVGRVVSVYAAGLEDPKKGFCEEDLGLREEGHYTYFNMRNHATIFKTLMFERLAKEHPDLSFIHVFPSLVMSDGFKTHPWPAWVKVLWEYVLAPILGTFYAVPQEESGARTLGLAASERFGRGSDERTASSTDGKIGGGAYSLHYDGRVNDVGKRYDALRGSAFDETVWEHTMGTIKDVEQAAGV